MFERCNEAECFAYMKPHHAFGAVSNTQEAILGNLQGVDGSGTNRYISVSAKYEAHLGFPNGLESIQDGAKQPKQRHC